jgi:hypothetical protein
MYLIQAELPLARLCDLQTLCTAQGVELAALGETGEVASGKEGSWAGGDLTQGGNTATAQRGHGLRWAYRCGGDDLL